MTEMMMRKVNGRLETVDAVSADEFSRVSATKELLVTIKAPRNPRQHRLAWALAQKIAEACDFLFDADDAMNWLKIKARHVRMIHDPRTGQVAIVPKSIAFASADQATFSRIFNRMVYVTCTEIIPGLDESALRAEIEAMVAPTHERQREAA